MKHTDSDRLNIFIYSKASVSLAQIRCMFLIKVIVTSIRSRNSILFCWKTDMKYTNKSNKWIKQILSGFFINYSYRKINPKNWFFIICFLLKDLNEFVLNLKWYMRIIKNLNSRSAGEYKKHTSRADWNNETSYQTSRQLPWTVI
jgi:hypothetical protein